VRAILSAANLVRASKKEKRMNPTMRPKSGRVYRVVLSLLLCAAVFLGVAGPAAAQKDKKKKNDAPAPNGTPVLPLPDEQQIDYMISTMLGAWQVGDVDKLHQTYADDVTVVNGIWAPPVIGWTNFLALYQQQRARMQQVRLDRTNTLVKVDGIVAWACYQWDFTGNVDGQPSRSVGQTTLVMEKRSNRWVIVHNHTSLVQATQPGVPIAPGSAPPATQPPAKPGGY
jgi:ketosteroid isomerase-like protein